MQVSSASFEPPRGQRSQEAPPPPAMLCLHILPLLFQMKGEGKGRVGPKYHRLLSARLVLIS